MSATQDDAEMIAAESPVSNSRWRRRGLALLVLFCVGGLSGLVARSYLFSRLATQVAQPSQVAPLSEAVESLPRASFSPEEVVRAQIESMRRAVDNPAALLTCYSLASPSNRRLTGPFERFAGLVTTEPYRQLGVCQDFQVGTAVMDGPTATVLVSTLAADGQGLAFIFLLIKQQEAPYRDCWMTDGVFPLLHQRPEIDQPKMGPEAQQPQLESRSLQNDEAAHGE